MPNAQFDKMQSLLMQMLINKKQNEAAGVRAREAAEFSATQAQANRQADLQEKVAMKFLDAQIANAAAGKDPINLDQLGLGEFTSPAEGILQERAGRERRTGQMPGVIQLYQELMGQGRPEDAEQVRQFWLQGTSEGRLPMRERQFQFGLGSGVAGQLEEQREAETELGVAKAKEERLEGRMAGRRGGIIDDFRKRVGKARKNFNKLSRSGAPEIELRRAAEVLRQEETALRRAIDPGGEILTIGPDGQMRYARGVTGEEKRLASTMLQENQVTQRFAQQIEEALAALERDPTSVGAIGEFRRTIQNIGGMADDFGVLAGLDSGRDVVSPQVKEWIGLADMGEDPMEGLKVDEFRSAYMFASMLRASSGARITVKEIQAARDLLQLVGGFKSAGLVSKRLRRLLKHVRRRDTDQQQRAEFVGITFPRIGEPETSPLERSGQAEYGGGVQPAGVPPAQVQMAPVSQPQPIAPGQAPAANPDVTDAQIFRTIKGMR